MEAIFKQFVGEFKNEIDTIGENYKSFSIKTSQLPDAIDYTFNRNILEHEDFRELFGYIRMLKTNCIYWFSVDTNEEAKELKQLISAKKVELWNADKSKCRVLPANNMNEDSNTIYVGVRKGGFSVKNKSSNIAGRIVQHLGYYKEGRTQGLQLAYYSKGLDIKLTFHIYSLENCPDEYLYIIEKLFAKKLKPICGKH